MLRGTYVSMTSGAFVYRRRDESVPSSPARLVEQGRGEIHSASVEQLALSSPEWFLADAQRRLGKTNLLKAYIWTAGILTICALIGSLALGVVAAALLGAGAFFIGRWDRERRTSRIHYTLEDPEIAERLAMATGAAEWLGQCVGLWHIFHSLQTSDWKKNAGAGTLIRRTRTRCSPGALPLFELNVSTWCVPVGPQQVLFLPDRILVWDGKNLAALLYEQLSIRSTTTRFIEDGGPLPSDGKQVGSTWRFVRKDGGPDRRFSNNAQLAVMEYGELELQSAGGLRLVLQTSNIRAADGAACALQALGDRARSPHSSSHGTVSRHLRAD
ncbi:MAG: hypothetical protein ABI548_10170 [Polyangiaceae bacterium]